MKTIWNGSISFGLVTIPVKLYSAVQPKSLKFKLLSKKDNSPIKYKRVSEKDGKEVKWEDIVKGYEISKGNYYTITKEELSKLKPEKSDLIEVLEFVNVDRIDPIYFNSHYYVAPEKEKEKSFFLFKNVLQTSGKAAIAKFVMHEKEHVCVIVSYKNGLLLTTLNYAYEIRDISEIEELKGSISLREEELKLAKTLIEQLTKEEFKISQFKDTFKEQLDEAIKNKEKGISRKSVSIKSEPDLIKALRQSLK